MGTRLYADLFAGVENYFFYDSRNAKAVVSSLFRVAGKIKL